MRSPGWKKAAIKVSQRSPTGIVLSMLSMLSVGDFNPPGPNCDPDRQPDTGPLEPPTTLVTESYLTPGFMPVQWSVPLVWCLGEAISAVEWFLGLRLQTCIETLSVSIRVTKLCKFTGSVQERECSSSISYPVYHYPSLMTADIFVAKTSKYTHWGFTNRWDVAGCGAAQNMKPSFRPKSHIGMYV